MSKPIPYSKIQGLSSQQVSQALREKYTIGGRPVMVMLAMELLALTVVIVRLLMILVNEPSQVSSVTTVMIATILIKGWCWNWIYGKPSFVPDWVRILMVGCGGAITFSLASCSISHLASWCHYSLGFDALVMVSVHPVWEHALDAYYLRRAVVLHCK